MSRRNTHWSAAVAAWLVAIGMAAASVAQQTPPGAQRDPPGDVVLEFPADRSMGLLYINLPEEVGREVDARGQVRVPAGHHMALTVSQPACADLAPLAGPVEAGLTEFVFRELVLYPNSIDELAALDGVTSLSFSSMDLSDDDLTRLARLRSLRKVSLFRVPVSDAGVARLASLPLTRLSLSYTKVTDRVWDTVAQFADLEDLRLGDPTISDVGFKHFDKLPRLEYLMFDRLDEVSGEALAHLATLPKLKALRFGSRDLRLDDAALETIARITSLEELDLSNAEISAGGLAQLSAMPSLRGLRLPDDATDERLARISELTSLTHVTCMADAVTDAGVAEIARLPKLEFLNLSCDAVSDESMRVLARSTTLEGLYVQHCQVGDEGLAALAALKSLERLVISSTQVTSDGLRHLQQLPALKYLIIYDLAGDNSRLAHLAGLTQLERLDLSNINREGTPFAEGDLEFLSGLRDLKYLKLHDFALTDAGARRVAALESLEEFQYFADDSRMTDTALGSFAAMPRLARLTVRGNFTDAGLELLATSRSLRLLGIESDTLSHAAIKKLRRVMAVQRLRQFQGHGRSLALFAGHGDLPATLGRARADCVRELKRVLLVVGDPAAKSTERLLRLVDQPDVHAALGNYEPVAVAAADKADLADLVGLDAAALAAIRGPTLVVVDESGQALPEARFTVSDDDEFVDPQRLVEFLETHKLRIDAELLLAAAFDRARLENKRVFLMQSSAYNEASRVLSKLLEDHAALFDLEYVVVPIDAERFENGDAVIGRYRSSGGLLPWVAILDATGGVLVTSDSPNGPIGFPNSDARIGYFMHMLGWTVQRARPEQLQQVRGALEQRVRRN